MSRDDSGARRESDVDDDRAGRWDADDERRRDDCFAPPAEPCECWCLHCRRVFMSDQIWFQRVVNDPQGFPGFWMCPTPNCGGAGFTFDIFPTDPSHPGNDGWYSDDGDDEDEEQFDEEGLLNERGEGGEWDPEESRYRALDEQFGDDQDDDLEGEEWKYGLQPGERPPAPDRVEEGRREWEEQEARFDQPDERPRVVDWSDREDRKERGGWRGDEDIPF
jgi:hypothetical protein